MLVNVSYDPKSRVKVEKHHRLMLQENPVIKQWDKEFRKTIKWHKKVFCFKGFFKPYEPRSWEYVPNDPDAVFTGVYVVADNSQTADMVNLLTKQNAVDLFARENYESGDICYSYGLCDNASQVIRYYNELKAEGKLRGNHIITINPMGKGGWRWHKWGDYIGEFDHKCEYFCDEKGIKNVWHFQIIRIK